jgi:hypothetical protein
MWESQLDNTLLLAIPHRKRKAKYIHWIKTFVCHISNVFDLLKLYRTEAIRQAYLTPQVTMLEKYLKDKFETEDIEIVDGELLGPWLFTAAQPSPAGSEFYLDQADSYVWNDEDQASFVVRVPDSFDDEVEIAQIAAIVSKFKLPGKNFIINKISE